MEAKILDMVPDFVNKFVPGSGRAAKESSTPDVDEAIHEASSEETTF